LYPFSVASGEGFFMGISKKVGIIAATPTDTKFGINIFSDRGYFAFGLSITSTPQEQTSLQALKKEDLTKRVYASVLKLIKLKVSVDVIYCNSLSGAIDLKYVRIHSSVPIVTPLDVYRNIARKYLVIGILAANGQSVANIERLILSEDKNTIIVGQGNLIIVNAIEAKTPPRWIINHFKINSLFKMYELIGCEIILLACTHFSYFKQELTKRKIQILDPADEIVKIVDSISK